MSTEPSNDDREPMPEDDATYELEPESTPQPTPATDAGSIREGDEPGADEKGVHEPSEGSDATPTPVDERRCQSCGAPMPEDGSIMVCPSCGYDIVTNRIVDPAAHRRSEDAEKESESEREIVGTPIVASDAVFPFLVPAGVLLATVAFAMIAGWSSFFPRIEGLFLDADGKAVLDAPRVPARFAAVLKLLVGSSVLVACGLVAARATAWFEERPLGDLRSVAARLTLAVAVAAVARLIPVESTTLQNIVHGVLGLGGLVGITMLAVGDRGRLAGLLLVGWGIAFLLVVPVARLVAWAIPIF